MAIPLRIIIEQFIITFPDHLHKDITEKSKKDLTELLQKHQKNRENRPRISDEVFMIDIKTGNIYDMGC